MACQTLIVGVSPRWLIRCVVGPRRNSRYPNDALAMLCRIRATLPGIGDFALLDPTPTISPVLGILVCVLVALTKADCNPTLCRGHHARRGSTAKAVQAWQTPRGRYSEGFSASSGQRDPRIFLSVRSLCQYEFLIDHKRRQHSVSQR